MEDEREKVWLREEDGSKLPDLVRWCESDCCEYEVNLVTPIIGDKPWTNWIDGNDGNDNDDVDDGDDEHDGDDNDDGGDDAVEQMLETIFMLQSLFTEIYTC